MTNSVIFNHKIESMKEMSHYKMTKHISVVVLSTTLPYQMLLILMDLTQLYSNECHTFISKKYFN